MRSVAPPLLLAPSPSVQNRPRCKREQSKVRKFFSGNPYSRISNAAEELGISFDMVWTILRNNWTRNRTVIYPHYTHAVKTGACTIRLKGGRLAWGSHLGGCKWFFLSFKHYRSNTVRWLMGSKRNKDHLRRMAGRARRRAEMCCTKLGRFFEHVLWARDERNINVFCSRSNVQHLLFLWYIGFTLFPVDICLWPYHSFIHSLMITLYLSLHYLSTTFICTYKEWPI